MQPPPIDLLSSPYFTLLETPKGGRSLFATVPIPANALIHISYSPCACVIYREFRKVVCAWCFVCKDLRKGGWCMAGKEENGRERFCGEVCRDLWKADGVKCHGLRERVDKAINAAVRRMNKSKAKSMSMPDRVANGGLDIALEITQATLDAAWVTAESETGTIIQLDEMELEIARFVSSALIQLHTDSISQGTTSSVSPAVLALQQNELPHSLQRPYILPTHIRISQFLRTSLSCIPEMRAYVSAGGSEKGWVRQILSRDAGNSFGIWEQPRGEGQQDGEREMFGWGIWTDASFFNHSYVLHCTPNVTKMRIGRALHFTTTKAIVAGEELCISYVGTDHDKDLNSADDVADDIKYRNGRERRRKLREQWFFACMCERCMTEKLEAT